MDGVNYQVVPRFFLLTSSKRCILLTRCGVYSRRRLLVILIPSAVFNRERHLIRGTQCQFSQNIRSEDDLKKKICCKISRLPTSPRIFEHLKNGITTHFKWIYTLKKSPRIFGSLFSSWNFRKGKFWSYNSRITRLSARKSEQTKNF